MHHRTVIDDLYAAALGLPWSPWRFSCAEAVKEAAAQVDRNPTDAARDAGNYKMGHARIHGLDVTIEVPKGGVRSKVGKDGKRWERKMKCHYGYIKKSAGKDGDHVDVYIGDDPDSEIVFVVNQQTKAGRFDEHKVVLGFTTEKDARDAYLDHYPRGWKVGPITALTMDQFSEWLEHGDLSKPCHP